MGVPKVWSLITKKVGGVEEMGCNQLAGFIIPVQISIKLITTQLKQTQYVVFAYLFLYWILVYNGEFHNVDYFDKKHMFTY